MTKMAKRVDIGCYGETPRILILRLSALGDTLMSTPVAYAIKEAFPNAYLGWVVEKRCSFILDGNPFINQIHIWDGTFKGFVKLIMSLQAADYDLSLDLQGLLKSSVIAWLAKIPVRVGFADGREGAPYLLTHRLPPPLPIPLVAGRNFQMLTALGIRVDPNRHKMHLPITDDNRRSAIQCLSKFNLFSKRFITLAPATTLPQKHWVEQRWSELAKLIWQELNLPCILLGGANDRSLLERISQQSSVPLPIFYDLPLKVAVALVEQTCVLVGLDSFLIHASLAVNTKTVALFGPTNPFRFQNEKSIQVIQHDLPCRPCRRHPICGGVFTCMRMITAREIVDVVSQLLDENLNIDPNPKGRSLLCGASAF